MLIVAPKRLLVKLLTLHLVLFILVIGFSSIVLTDDNINPSTKSYKVQINFLVPMDKRTFSNSLKLTSEFPNKKNKFEISWISDSIAEIEFWDTQYPQGQEITIEIVKARTKIPLITKSKTIRFRLPIEPVILGFNTKKLISTLDPIMIRFNVPMEQQDVKKGVIVINLETGKKIDGIFKPSRRMIEGKQFQDESCWLFEPKNKFRNGERYKVIIESGLASKAGVKLNKSYEKIFSVASKPYFIEYVPSNKAQNVSLYPKIVLKASEQLKRGIVTLKRQDKDSKIIVRGITQVDNTQITFKSEDVLLPNSTYLVEAIGYTLHGEPTDKVSFYFSTLKVNNKYWVDVKLGDIHTVTVYKDQIAVRHMVASGGKEETKTPLGTYYTGDKGYSFWSPRFGEGAIYWVRLVGQILFHSVPRGSNGEIKEEEHYKLGLPASHGCIRLDDNDAKWFFENIPYGTPVIIHN